MFNDLIIREGSLSNIDEDGAVIGFSFDTHIAYYRGLGLSMVHAPVVSVDGSVIPPESLRFTLNARTYTFAELADVIDVRWELKEFATITALAPGGLSTGQHTLSVTQTLRVSYLPVLCKNTYTREVTIS